jgi:hypothetical protein
MNILQVQNLPTFIVAQGLQKPIATIDISWDLRLWGRGGQYSTSSICYPYGSAPYSTLSPTIFHPIRMVGHTDNYIY